MVNGGFKRIQVRDRIVAIDGGADRELLNGLAGVVADHASRFEPLEVHRASDGPEVGEWASVLGPRRPHCLILCLPEQGLPFASACFKALRNLPVVPPILCLAEGGSASDLSHLWSLGARDLLLPPVRSSDWGARLLRDGVAAGVSVGDAPSCLQHPALEQVVGESPAWRTAFSQVLSVASWNVSVLIRGETGTGKELCARAIHYLSPRGGGPFVAVNCGAIPVELIENELFGHEKGAFTGAIQPTAGLIQEAEGGTVFFDEVDALPPGAQVKLLRLLQQKTFRRLGSARERQADFRVIAATNGDLKASVQQRHFREDLYYRINVFELLLPPLRNRREDIPLLAAHFLRRFAAEQRRPLRQLTPEVIEILACQPWPGNIRELENVLQRAIVVAGDNPLKAEHLNLPHHDALPDRIDESFQRLKAETIARFEHRLLSRLMAEHQGNITHAARAAKKNRRAFWQLLCKHGLQGTDSRCRPRKKS